MFSSGVKVTPMILSFLLGGGIDFDNCWYGPGFSVARHLSVAKL